MLMTRRQFQRIQCRMRRGVNELYYSYLASVLRGLEALDPAGDIDRALATLPVRRRCESSTEQSRRASVGLRELKQRSDLGCARVREKLWQLQHLQLDLSTAGERP